MRSAKATLKRTARHDTGAALDARSQEVHDIGMAQLGQHGQLCLDLAENSWYAVHRLMTKHMSGGMRGVIIMRDHALKNQPYPSHCDVAIR